MLLFLLLASLVAAVPAQARVPKCLGKKATIVGNGKSNTIRGTKRSDVIFAGGGNDVVRGGGGHDLICGSGGADTIFGQAGDDKIDLGGGGPDTGHGGPGNDLIRGRARELDAVSYQHSRLPIQGDLGSGLIRGEGTDTVDGISHIIGTQHDDSIFGTPNDNIMYGLGGNDTIDAEGGNDEVFGFASPDRENASDGDDTLIGGPGNDTVAGGTGNDDLEGSDGIDTLDGGTGNDTMDGGGQAFDAVDFTGATQGVNVNLASGAASGMGADTVTGVTDVFGTGFADTLLGSARPFEGFAGFSGDDSINGSGGEGDAVIHQYDTTSVTVNLLGGTATGTYTGSDLISQIEVVVGSEYDDSITGDDGPNEVYALFGNDSIIGRAGDDLLDGGDSIDTIDGGIGNDICLNGETISFCESTTRPVARTRTTATSGARPAAPLAVMSQGPFLRY